VTETYLKSNPPSSTTIVHGQILAAGRLYPRLESWVRADRAFAALVERLPGFDQATTLLKVAAINQLYFTNVMAIYRLADHVHAVMQSPPSTPVELVEALAALRPAREGQKTRNHWNFASKFAHFFVDAEAHPIYDRYALEMVRHLLGRELVVAEARPYPGFYRGVGIIRKRSRLRCTARELDRYLWLAGQYRVHHTSANPQLSVEVTQIFESSDESIRRIAAHRQRSCSFASASFSLPAMKEPGQPESPRSP
jgi:hypothetical protein